MTDRELLPCPFCGAGTTEIRENGRPWLGTRYGDPSSVSVRHWCEPIEGQPSRMIERVGRDRAAAVAAWNTRATDANLAALQAEIEALREDAERWRALREMDGGEIYALLGDCDGIHPEQADAAIDQAREKGV